MVLGVEENEARLAAFAEEEFIVPEFGKVSMQWFDLKKKYRGALFRLNPEAARQICEIVGFSANFELAGIRSAYLDISKTAAFFRLEMDRNTKPTDLAARYSRERWTLIDAARKQDANCPWIKAEFEARFLPERIIGQLANELKMSSENAVEFIIRINFKEKFFAVIAEDRLQEQMPAGGFSGFSLPSQAMLALAEKYARSGVFEKSELAKHEALDQSIEAEVSKTAESGAEEPGSTEPERAESERAESVEAESGAAESGAEEPASVESERAESVAAESERAKSESNETTALPGSTKALEKFIIRKENRPQINVQEMKETRREQAVENSVKYATYSRSEVDHMLKQQTENITSALGSKISSQQRVFQEAVDRQEKSFAKLSDQFVFQFDQTRQRLENSSKQSEESIKTELDAFKQDLSKELEQYRAQINKAVVPVAKFIEEKNKAPEKAAREPAPKNKPDQGTPDNNKPLLIANLVLVLIVVGALFAVVMPDLAKIEELQRRVDELNAKLTRSGAGTSAGTSSIVSGHGSAGNLTPEANDENSASVSSNGSK